MQAGSVNGSFSPHHFVTVEEALSLPFLIQESCSGHVVGDDLLRRTRDGVKVYQELFVVLEEEGADEFDEDDQKCVHPRSLSSFLSCSPVTIATVKSRRSERQQWQHRPTTTL